MLTVGDDIGLRGVGLFGQRGDDELFGGNGRDLLVGGHDDDYLEGGFGFDWLMGMQGEDEFDGMDDRREYADLTAGAGQPRQGSAIQPAHARAGQLRDTLREELSAATRGVR